MFTVRHNRISDLYCYVRHVLLSVRARLRSHHDVNKGSTPSSLSVSAQLCSITDYVLNGVVLKVHGAHFKHALCEHTPVNEHVRVSDS